MSTALRGAVTPPDGSDLYETDEHEWIETQVSALRSGRFELLDREHLIEYLTSMTIRDRRELKSRLTVLLMHLLKIRMQPEMQSSSWGHTILEQQQEIASIVEDTPSLGRQADALARAGYPAAVRRAARETGLRASTFPVESPWTVAQALAFDPPVPLNKKWKRR